MSFEFWRERVKEGFVPIHPQQSHEQWKEKVLESPEVAKAVEAYGRNHPKVKAAEKKAALRVFGPQGGEQILRSYHKKTAESTEEPNQIPSPQSPTSKAIEEVMVKKLDRDAMAEEGAHPETKVIREPTIVKISNDEFWNKVAECVKDIKTKRGKYKTPPQFLSKR